jgi:hypothetical protein
MQRFSSGHGASFGFPKASLLSEVCLQEQDDEWQVAERRNFSIESMNSIDAQLEGGDVSKELLAANRLRPRMVRVNLNHLTGHDPRPTPLCRVSVDA